MTAASSLELAPCRSMSSYSTGLVISHGSRYNVRKVTLSTLGTTELRRKSRMPGPVVARSCSSPSVGGLCFLKMRLEISNSSWDKRSRSLITEKAPVRKLACKKVDGETVLKP